MEVFVIYLSLVLFGLCFGSFAGASVWRLRARQLVQDKSDGEPIDKDEFKRLKKLTKTKISKDHSRCLNCSYQLKWYDLLPLVSWLSLGGKCRKCHNPIGLMEPMIELGVAFVFVLSYAFWPHAFVKGIDVAIFVVWLVSIVGLAILFVYDLKWFLLPDFVNFSIIGLGSVSAILVFVNSNDKTATLISIACSALILSGLYWMLYRLSDGKWVGFGDVKLGLGLALLLADWQLAFIALFTANLIGCILVLPGMLTGKLKPSSHVPFGPLLIAGFLIAGLFGISLLNNYYYYL